MGIYYYYYYYYYFYYYFYYYYYYPYLFNAFHIGIGTFSEHTEFASVFFCSPVL